MKRNSLFALYFLAIAFALFLFTPSHLSTNMLAIFQEDENIEKLKTMNSFEQASTLFVVSKGFSKEQRNLLLEVEKKLQALECVKSTKFNLSKIEISDYMKKNYYLLSEFQGIELSKSIVDERLKRLKEELLTATFYTPIDKNDPFKLFNFKFVSSENMTKDSYLVLGEEGYLLTAELNAKTSNMEQAREIEATLSTLFEPYKELTAFSTLFFTAQNSSIIEANVHEILYLSFALLLIVFFLTLRDYRVLLLNMITLASSILFALAISTYIFSELSIFVLAFGSAVSSISVDYLFHNYFHGQYKKEQISKTIMWAFLTTVLGFTMLSFVSFPLIAQLSVFALLSLSFSYFQFTFLYPYFQLEPKPNRVKLSFDRGLKKILPVNGVFIFSLIAIVYASINMEFDYNLQNLDYDNKDLKAKQALIQDALPNRATLLIEAESLDLLVTRVKALKKETPSLSSLADFTLSQAEFEEKREALAQYDFVVLKRLLEISAENSGFKKGYFSEAYKFVEKIPTEYQPSLEVFKTLGYEVIVREHLFYTIATLPKKELEKFSPVAGVSIIDTATLIGSSMGAMFKSLLLYLLLSFLAVVTIVLMIVREKSILALNFILFPIAVILLYLSFFQINIMHLFSIIIIIVAGIDYGIYMSRENSTETKEAIFYSLFTTFSGFGILIWSSIGAIHSIGEVITIGILAILILVLFLKNK